MKTSQIAQPGSLTGMHYLLAIQSIIIILLSINRLSSFTNGFVADNEFLRWVDFNNMLVLPLISVVAFYLLKKHLEYDNREREERRHLLVNVLFLVGVYLLAAGYGDHEITNYLHTRFCAETDSILCRIIIFNDDDFSHWVFFAGFIFINTAIMLIQVLFPTTEPTKNKDKILLVSNGLLIGFGIFANLAFEEIGVDLYVIAGLAFFSIYLLIKFKAQPILLYYVTAYSIGLALTAVYKII